MKQDAELQERPFAVADDTLPVICKKCGAAFIVPNTAPVNKRVALPFAPDCPPKGLQTLGTYGRFGQFLVKNREVAAKLEEAAARAFACANGGHSEEYLVPLAGLTQEELGEILAKRLTYDRKTHSILIWSDNGELCSVTGNVEVSFHKGMVRWLPKVVRDTIWYVPPTP
jgi:hypothetical protein